MGKGRDMKVKMEVWGAVSGQRQRATGNDSLGGTARAGDLPFAQPEPT